MPPKKKSRAIEAQKRRKHRKSQLEVLRAARIPVPGSSSDEDGDPYPPLYTDATAVPDQQGDRRGDAPATSGRHLSGRRLLYGHPQGIESEIPNDASFSDMSSHGDDPRVNASLTDATDESILNSDPRSTSEDNNEVVSSSQEVEPEPIEEAHVTSSSSTSSNEPMPSEDEAQGTSVQEDVAHFVSKHSLTWSSTRELLSIFKKAGVQGLPKDRRTLLKTPRSVPGVVELAGGSFKYFGIESGLKDFLKQHPDVARLHGHLDLYVSVDGLPLHKSSKSQFWPILCKVDGGEPFIAALFHGHQKPTSVDDFLAEFLQEYEDLRENGLQFEGETYDVRVKCWVCDAPARCFLKNIKGHTGYYACERCKVKGLYRERKVTYPVDGAYESRTDEQFAQMAYHNGADGDEHQSGQPSPLIRAGLNCVSAVVLDIMHCAYLGVWRRFLQYLFTGPRRLCRLSNAQKNRLDMRLLRLRLPREFCRQPRTLFQMEYWKATEFRSSLLYTGIIFLMGIVSDEIYDLYLKLAVAMNILHTENDERRTEYLPYARALILEFIRDSSHLLGPSFVVYNVHSLSHIPDDVEQFQCSVNSISAFPFENHLQTVKKLVKSAHNPIGQVYSRLHEMRHQNVFKHQKVIEAFISTRSADSMFFLNDTQEFCMIQRRRRRDGRFDVLVFSAAIAQDYFRRPCESTRVGIYLVKNLDTIHTRAMVKSRAELTHKVVVMPLENGRDYVLIPMLHDAEA